MAIVLKISLQGARRRKESQQRGFSLRFKSPLVERKMEALCRIPGQLHRITLFRDREKTERPGLLESAQLSSRFALPEQIGLLFTYLTFFVYCCFNQERCGKELLDRLRIVPARGAQEKSHRPDSPPHVNV